MARGASHRPRKTHVAKACVAQAWTLGYVAQFAHAGGVEALMLMSLRGPSGIVQWAPDARLVTHPAYFALARLGAAARVCSVAVSDLLRVAAPALDREGTAELLLANLTGEPIDIHLDGWAASAQAMTLDADSTKRGPRGLRGWHLWHGWRSPGARL